MYALLRLLTAQPQLLADHAEAYAELVTAEIGDLSAAWKRRAVLHAATLCCLGAGAVLAGVALMLWTVTPSALLRLPWVLIVVPLLPLAGAAACLLAGRADDDGKAFDNVRRQLKADLAVLREATAP